MLKGDDCVVCDTAKVRFFKQITTYTIVHIFLVRCLRYCKSTIFQANHNQYASFHPLFLVVCDTAKVRFFKQITTAITNNAIHERLFAILQKYDFSSKSQPQIHKRIINLCCLRYCKSTIFQANHNPILLMLEQIPVVCDTAKVRFFKQITTYSRTSSSVPQLFAILQKYDFSSKSQHRLLMSLRSICCLRYCKSTIFQANHNPHFTLKCLVTVVCDTAKVRFFKQITTWHVVDTY